MKAVRVSIAFVALALVAAACGGPARAGSGSNAKEKTADDQLVEYTRCMRDHGVDIDAESDGEGRFNVTIGAPGGGGKGGEDGGSGAQGGPDAKTEAAMKACEDKLPRGQDLSPEERARLDDQLLEFAKCMREHGIDMPDPQEGGFIQRFDGNGGNARSGPDPESAEFKAAEKACEDKLPNKGAKREVSRRGAN